MTPEISLTLDEAVGLGIVEKETPDFQGRLYAAIKARTINAGKSLVVVSNRSETSHVLLRTTEAGEAQAAWIETLHSKIGRPISLMIGHIEFPADGHIRETQGEVFEVQQTSEVKEVFESTGGINICGPERRVLLGKPLLPQQAFEFRQTGKSNVFYEVPLNTATLIAEHGHINSVLTQTAISASLKS